MHKLIPYKLRKITPSVHTFHPKRFCFQRSLSPSSGIIIINTFCIHVHFTSNVHVYKNQISKDYSDIKLFYFNNGRFGRTSDLRGMISSRNLFSRNLHLLESFFSFVSLKCFLNRWLYNYSAVHKIQQNISSQSSFQNS